MSKEEGEGRGVPSARPLTRIQAANRAAILKAALQVFSSFGFRGSTVDQIARTAGMTKANLLYYFPRKEDVYEAVLQHTLTQWLTPLRTLDPDGDPYRELRGYILAKLRFSFERPEASRLFASEILQGAPLIMEFLKTELRQLVEAKASVITSWAEKGWIRPVDPVHLIFMIWATTQHYADFAVQIDAVVGQRATTERFREEAADVILAIVMNGLQPSKPVIGSPV